jgi:small subunit ribosomal protein S1
MAMIHHEELLEPTLDPATSLDATASLDAVASENVESAANAEVTATAADVTPAEATATPGVPATDPALEERRRRAQEAWEHVVQARESGEVLSGFVTAAVKGGLLVDIAGIRGFLPASQVRVAQGESIETLLKKRVPLKVLDTDATRRRAVVSQRRALEEERRGKRAELLHSLAVGQQREAVVVRLADFGAFVDLGGLDALIPMSELAFERVEKASDVVNVGDRLAVQVLRIEEGGKKIAVSRKSALPDPWRDHAELLRAGSVIEGKVFGKEPRLQVEIAPGIIGMVRESDADPADYEIGETIEVSVRSVDRRTRRIVLTTVHGAAAVAATFTSGFAPLGLELQQRPPRKRR